MNRNKGQHLNLLLLLAILFLITPANGAPLMIESVSLGSVQQQSELASSKVPSRLSARPQRTVAIAARHDTPNSIFFTGDVFLGRNVEVLSHVHGAAYPFTGIEYHQFTDDFHLIGNFEASVPARHQPTKPFSLVFSVPTTSLPALHNAGFTHLSLANNHSLDFGESGLSNTIMALEDAGLTPFGAPGEVSSFSLTQLETAKGQVAVVAIDATMRSLDLQALSSLLRDAEDHSALTVVYVHWGIEYEWESHKSQQMLAEHVVQAGADLVIGHHPHVVQEVGLIDGVPVFYSLGNYIFDQYFSPDVLSGLVLHLDLDRNSPRIDLLPVHQASLSKPTLMPSEAHQTFLEELAGKSASELQPLIRQGYVPLQPIVATSSKIAMIKEY